MRWKQDLSLFTDSPEGPTSPPLSLMTLFLFMALCVGGFLL